MHPRLELAACHGLASLPRELLARYYGEKTQQSTTVRLETAQPSWKGLTRRNGSGGALVWSSFLFRSSLEAPVARDERGCL